MADPDQRLSSTAVVGTRRRGCCSTRAKSGARISTAESLDMRSLESCSLLMDPARDRHRSRRRLPPLQGPASRATPHRDRKRQICTRRARPRPEATIGQPDQQDHRHPPGDPRDSRRVRAHTLKPSRRQTPTPQATRTPAPPPSWPPRPHRPQVHPPHLHPPYALRPNERARLKALVDGHQLQAPGADPALDAPGDKEIEVWS